MWFLLGIWKLAAVQVDSSILSSLVGIYCRKFVYAVLFVAFKLIAEQELKVA